MGRIILCFIFVSTFLFSACTFGDSSSIPDYSNTLRYYPFSFYLKDAPSEGVAMISSYTYGDTVLWLQRDAEDSLLYTSADSAYLSHGMNISVSFFQPYSLLEGKSNSMTRITLDYQGQDGTLETIESDYNYKYKEVSAYCTSLEHKTLVTYSDDTISLQPLHFFLRLSLVDSTAENSLATHLQSLASEKGIGFRITEIRITDTNLKVQLYDKVNYYLETGEVYKAASSNKYVSLQDPDGHDMTTFKLLSIGASESEDNYNLSYEGISWGTSCYAALPCVSTNDSVNLSLQIMVSGDMGPETFTYYGALESNYCFSSGQTYITAPVRCYTQADALLADEQAEVWLKDDLE